MRIRLLTSCFLFIALLNSSEAVDTDPSLPPNFPLTVAPTATLKKPPVKSLSMGSLTIQIETTRLKDVLTKIGIGKIQHRGDAAESTYWLCYLIPNSIHQARIWLMSGEIDGGTVGSIAVKLTKPDETETPSCPALPTNYRPVQFERKIGLENKESDLRKILGKASLVANDWIHFDSEQEVMIHGEKFTELGSLSARFVKGRIEELWISKTTSD
jgi:hypothetical protein